MQTPLLDQLELLHFLAENQPTRAEALERFGITRPTFQRWVRDLRLYGARFAQDRGRWVVTNWEQVRPLASRWRELEREKAREMEAGRFLAGRAS